MDLAFASAVLDATRHPAVLRAEAKKIQARLQEAENALARQQAEVDLLGERRLVPVAFEVRRLLAQGVDLPGQRENHQILDERSFSARVRAGEITPLEAGQ